VTGSSFRLVSLSVDTIIRQDSVHSVRMKLKKLAGGDGLSEAYRSTLTRLKAHGGVKSVLWQKALMWVLYSERPLRDEELCHALGVEIGYMDLDSKNFPTMQTVLSSCLGLLTVEAPSSIVRLVHFTLQKSLSSDPTLLPTLFPNPQSTIAEVCLTYLNFISIRALSPTSRLAPSTIPLLEYASYYWGEHARRGVTQNVKRLALRLLDKFDEHISAPLLLLHNRQYTMLSRVAGGPVGFTGLHGVAFLGIVEIVATVLEMKEWNINAADCMGNTALMWAVRGGHEAVVKVLLEQEGVDPDHVDHEYGRTALIWAIIAGHEGVVKMLLGQGDVNPNKTDTEYGRTPLSWAAESGHKGIVLMLLEREDINPDYADAEYSRTPLMWAIIAGCEGIVRVLLQLEDVSPDYAHPESGVTPLLLATMNGHEGMVKMLLQRKDINPDCTDPEYGRTPLMWAIITGRERSVKILLESKDVNPDYAHPESGVTPLLLAAVSGHEGIVKMLLERKDVNPDRADAEYGQTPLSRAAAWGHEGVVKMLLEREDVNPIRADTKDSRTPLAWATRNGHEGVVKILVQRQDIRHDGVARIVIEKHNANLGQANHGGHASLPPGGLGLARTSP